MEGENLHEQIDTAPGVHCVIPILWIQQPTELVGAWLGTQCKRNIRGTDRKPWR